MATRSFWNNWVRCMESAAATSPWLPPGGSCHDEISASRNRYFVVTDEGWRWLKVSDFPVEWRKPEHMPLIQLHSFTNLSPPLIRLFCQSVPKCRLSKKPASPRGKPRTQEPSNITIQRTTPLCELREANSLPYWACATMQPLLSFSALWIGAAN